MIFDLVRRVLRDYGTLWLNLGDSYTSGNRATRAPDKTNPVRAMNYRARTPKGMKPKTSSGYRGWWPLPSGTLAGNPPELAPNNGAPTTVVRTCLREGFPEHKALPGAP